MAPVGAGHTMQRLQLPQRGFGPGASAGKTPVGEASWPIKEQEPRRGGSRCPFLPSSRPACSPRPCPAAVALSTQTTPRTPAADAQPAANRQQAAIDQPLIVRGPSRKRATAKAACARSRPRGNSAPPPSRLVTPTAGPRIRCRLGSAHPRSHRGLMGLPQPALQRGGAQLQPLPAWHGGIPTASNPRAAASRLQGQKAGPPSISVAPPGACWLAGLGGLRAHP